MKKRNKLLLDSIRVASFTTTHTGKVKGGAARDTLPEYTCDPEYCEPVGTDECKTR